MKRFLKSVAMCLCVPLYLACGDNAADQKPLGAFCFRTSECASGLICLENECSGELSESDSMGTGANGDAGIDDGG